MAGSPYAPVQLLGMKRQYNVVATTLVIAALMATTIAWLAKPPAYTDACLESSAGFVVCAASDMERIPRNGSIPLVHADFNLSQGPLRLYAAKNETIAFQLLVQNQGGGAGVDLKIENSVWSTKTGKQINGIEQQIFQAHYHRVDKGGYTWGPKTTVLDWPADYPDALVPDTKRCLEEQHLFANIDLPKIAGHNQAVWIDLYISPTMPTGVFQQATTVIIADKALSIPLELTVVDAVLPDKPSFDAIGEIYRSYTLEGVGMNRATKPWQAMSRCYQQLAHQHRLVFFERTPDKPSGEQWPEYIDTFGPALTGELFTDAYGYSGTGKNTPVSVWRTPWPQEYNIVLDAPLDADALHRYTELAGEWALLASAEQWTDTEFFAYIFDEVDGPQSGPQEKKARRAYLTMVHTEMQRLQHAIDTGSPTLPIDLLWTSHANPANWAGDPELDLTNIIRRWSPNASAADPSFLHARATAGDKAWFYHSGHPAVGAHSINVSGIEMRTWGVIAARYGLHGNFMWAVNLGSDERPFAEPSYKPEDDRFGNGVLVYPGNQLERIGFRNAPGPIPSMRLKAWRRGLQDAELYVLAKQKNSKTANDAILKMIPNALADASGKAQWPRQSAAWIDFKKALLETASGQVLPH